MHPALTLATVLIALAIPQQPVADAIRVTEPIELDGRLDDTAWRAAKPVSGFRQREPDEGAPPSDSTVFWVVYDAAALYVGIAAYHRAGITTTARILQRDRLLVSDVFGDIQWGTDDAVAVLIDPFHDHRNAVIFATNPNAADFEAQLTDEGREFNVAWRAVWRVRSARFDGGWSAEFEIPFRTLRYPGGDGPRTWGFNVARIVRHTNEETLWASWSQDNEGLRRVSRAGHLTGLDNLPRSGLALDAKPFVMGDLSTSRGALQATPEVGLDLKYQLRPGLTLDVTANTDFSHVEADSQQVNLTRFDLFVPEKRDFFLENAGIFEFGQRLPAEPPLLLLFFPRRIGIDEQSRLEVPILGGVRLTGRVGSQTLGLLDVVTDSSAVRGRTNYAVARVTRDIGTNSYVGAMLTDVRSSDFANWAGGVDASLWPTSRLNIQGFYSRTDTGSRGADGSAYRLGWAYETGAWGVSGYAAGVSPEAQAGAGFIGRTDMRRYEVFGRLTHRPAATLGLRKVNVFALANTITRWDGTSQDYRYGPALEFVRGSGESLTAYALRGVTRLDKQFKLSDTLTVDAGEFPFAMLGWFGSTAPHRPVVAYASGTFTHTWGGDLVTVQGSLTIRPDRHVHLNAGSTRTRVRLPNGAFTAHLVNVRLSYALSTRAVLDALVQYGSLDRSVTASVRLTVIHRPGSDLYIVVNEVRGGNVTTRRATSAKLTYLARL